MSEAAGVLGESLAVGSVGSAEIHPGIPIPPEVGASHGQVGESKTFQNFNPPTVNVTATTNGAVLATMSNMIVVVYKAQSAAGYTAYVSLQYHLASVGGQTAPQIVNPPPGGGFRVQIILKNAQHGGLLSVDTSQATVWCHQSADPFFSAGISPDVYDLTENVSLQGESCTWQFC